MHARRKKNETNRAREAGQAGPRTQRALDGRPEARLATRPMHVWATEPAILRASRMWGWCSVRAANAARTSTDVRARFPGSRGCNGSAFHVMRNGAGAWTGARLVSVINVWQAGRA
jgi:hypothetical protein